MPLILSFRIRCAEHVRCDAHSLSEYEETCVRAQRVATTFRCVCPFFTRSFSPSAFDHSSHRAARHLRSLHLLLHTRYPLIHANTHPPWLTIRLPPRPIPTARNPGARNTTASAEWSETGKLERRLAEARPVRPSFAITHSRARALTAHQDALRLPSTSKRSSVLLLRSSPSMRSSPAVCPSTTPTNSRRRSCSELSARSCL